MVVVAFAFGLIDNISNAEPLQKTAIGFCVFFLLVSLVTFSLSIFVEPGYLQPKFEFIQLIDNFLENNIHLDNLCVFCQVIITEQSFHCTICNRCSDNYDHHCPFINNCLGTRNHKYFLLFISNYFCYSLLVIACSIYRYFVIASNPAGHGYDIGWTTILFVLIVLPMPVLVFQLKEQCRNLRKKKVLVH